VPVRASFGQVNQAPRATARAADITYIRAPASGELYLSLLMDKWSRKTVGFHAGDTLEAEGAVSALETALKELPGEAFPVHHSDRRCRYCPHRYVETLAGRGLPVSMTEELKQEYGLGCSFQDKKQALRAVAEAVSLYNTRRPHPALNYETPETMHRMAA
jgi:putative transposase